MPLDQPAVHQFPPAPSCAARARTTVPTPAPCTSRSKMAARSRSRATPSIRRPTACYAPRSRATSSAPTPTLACCYPLQRVGKKGEGKFRRIGWDEALDTIAARFTRNRRIGRRSAGDCPLQLRRHHGPAAIRLDGSAFFPQAGRVAARSHDLRDGRQGRLYRDVGAAIGIDMEEFENARLILIWGSNPIVSNLHLWSRVQEAKRRGAKLDRDRSLPQPDRGKVSRPPRAASGDRRGAGVGHDACAHRREPDRPRLYRSLHARIRASFGFGSATIRRSVSRKSRGLSVEQIVDLARDYGTIRPAAIRLNYGMQRHAGGGMAMRTAACLPALVGAWRDPAGGALLSSSGTYPVNDAALERPDLIWNAPRTINMSTIGDALLDADDPPVRALFVYNSNPVAVAPESAKVVAGFASRGSLLRRARRFSHRHRRLRRHRASGHDAARARGHPFVVRAPVRAGQQCRHCAAGRGQAQYRSIPAARRAHGLRRAVLPRKRRGHGAQRVPRRSSSRARPFLGHAQGKRLAASQRTLPFRTVRARKLSDAFGKVRVFFADAGRPGARSTCRLSLRRENRRQATRRWRGDTRSRCSRRRRATRSTPPSPTCPCSSIRKRCRRSTFILSTPRRAASTMAIGCEYSTIAAR